MPEYISQGGSWKRKEAVEAKAPDIIIPKEEVKEEVKEVKPITKPKPKKKKGR